MLDLNQRMRESKSRALPLGERAITSAICIKDERETNKNVICNILPPTVNYEAIINIYKRRCRTLLPLIKFDEAANTDEGVRPRSVIR